MTDRERWEEIRASLVLPSGIDTKQLSQKHGALCASLIATQARLDEACKRLAAQERELAEAERTHLETIDERDRHTEALSKAHIALGGDGEWVAKPGSVCLAGETGDLATDVPALAESVMRELAEARARVGELEGAICRYVSWEDEGGPHGYRYEISLLRKVVSDE